MKKQLISFVFLTVFSFILCSGFIQRVPENNTSINGGNINGTAIGATTASTGAFTTLSGVTINASGAYTGGNVSNWNTAYADRLKWDGNATSLNASTGRTSLGLGSMATQVSDNVTIKGGTINGTVIGGSSAVTGNFTSLTMTLIHLNSAVTTQNITPNCTVIMKFNGVNYEVPCRRQ